MRKDMQGKADETECPQNWAGRHRRQRKSDQESRISAASGRDSACAQREVMIGFDPVMPVGARRGLREVPARLSRALRCGAP